MTINQSMNSLEFVCPLYTESGRCWMSA